MEREAMEFDMVVVGGGPSGLAAAIRFAQMAAESGDEFTVCLVEKGSEIGAHILSGAVVEPTALNELIPDWKKLGCPLANPVTEDEMYYLVDHFQGLKLPGFLIPPALHNHGNYATSLGNLCRWLGTQAEELGVMLFPGFAASEVLYDEAGAIAGVATGDMGVNSQGEHKSTFAPGYELRAKYTVFAEGCRGHLGKQLFEKFNLRAEGGTEEGIVTSDSPSTPRNHHRLNTTLCKDYCETSCISYITPLNSCFNPQKLFPSDESWGEGDVLDDNVTFSSDEGQVSFVRTFYSTNDATCGGLCESEMLPLNECIGPFGAPRPWGTFELSSSE